MSKTTANTFNVLVACDDVSGCERDPEICNIVEQMAEGVMLNSIDEDWYSTIKPYTIDELNSDLMGASWDTDELERLLECGKAPYYRILRESYGFEFEAFYGRFTDLELQAIAYDLMQLSNIHYNFETCTWDFGTSYDDFPWYVCDEIIKALIADHCAGSCHEFDESDRYCMFYNWKHGLN